MPKKRNGLDMFHGITMINTVQFKDNDRFYSSVFSTITQDSFFSKPGPNIHDLDCVFCS